MRHARSSAVIRLIGLLLGTTVIAAIPVEPVQAQEAGARSFSIAPQALDDALTRYGQQVGVMMSVDAALLQGKRSPGASGTLPPIEALRRILAGSGLTWRQTGGMLIIGLPEPQASVDTGAGGYVQLDPVVITGDRPAVWDGSPETVFDTPSAVSVITADQLETFRGTTPSDLLKSAPGLFSAESRASGGLDINIRGLQGQGRVAVTVDGTTNRNSVYRGYQGIGNRSYVDPDFIAGISVDKGPGATTGAIGGTVAMRTYGVDDLFPEGDRVGIRLRYEMSGNSSDPYGSEMLGRADSSGGYTYTDSPILESSGFGGTSASALLGLRGDRFDLVLGFARRKNGNYHAGSEGGGAGERIVCPVDPASCAAFPDRVYYTMSQTGYEPRPADAIALARAGVVLTNGLEFEGFMTRLIAASGTAAPITVLTDGVETMEEEGGGHYHYGNGAATFHAGAHDPHAWQSVANAKICVANVAVAFCAADAQGCAAYEANAATYLAQLDALETEIRSTIAALPEDRRSVVVAHNAFRYFEAAYGVTFLSPQGVSTESQAAAADVAGLIRQIRETGAGAIFAENISDTRLLEQIGREAGLSLSGTLYSDALSGPEGPAPSYIAMMRHNSAAIAAELSRD